MTVVLYSRVSLEDQTVENQRLAAKQAGYHIDEVFADSGVSGGIKAMDRPEFSRMMGVLKEGDILIVSAADRIGRNTADVILTVEKFVAMKVKLVILAYGSMDFTSDIGMAILSVGATFATLERSQLRRRTSQGMKRAKEEGVMLGQPLKITPDTLKQMFEYKQQGLPLTKISHICGVERTTATRTMKRWEGNIDGYRNEYMKREIQYASRTIN